MRRPSARSASSASRAPALIGSATAIDAREPSVDGDIEHASAPAAGAPPPACPRRDTSTPRSRASSRRCRRATSRPPTAPRTPCPGRRFEVASPTASVSPLRPARRATIAAASGCSLPCSERGGEAQHLLFGAAAGRRDATTLGPPFGQRAGLVDDDGVDLLEPLERLGVLARARLPTRRARCRP